MLHIPELSNPTGITILDGDAYVAGGQANVLFKLGPGYVRSVRYFDGPVYNVCTDDTSVFVTMEDSVLIVDDALDTLYSADYDSKWLGVADDFVVVEDADGAKAALLSASNLALLKEVVVPFRVGYALGQDDVVWIFELDGNGIASIGIEGIIDVYDVTSANGVIQGYIENGVMSVVCEGGNRVVRFDTYELWEITSSRYDSPVYVFFDVVSQAEVVGQTSNAPLGATVGDSKGDATFLLYRGGYYEAFERSPLEPPGDMVTWLDFTDPEWYTIDSGTGLLGSAIDRVDLVDRLQYGAILSYPTKGKLSIESSASTTAYVNLNASPLTFGAAFSVEQTISHCVKFTGAYGAENRITQGAGLYIQVVDSATNTYRYVDRSGDEIEFVVDEGQHVLTVVTSGTTVTLYIDGEFAGSCVWGGLAPMLNFQLIFGQTGGIESGVTEVWSFIGYNTALSTDEVAQLAEYQLNTEYTPVLMTGSWSLTEGYGTVLPSEV